MKYTLSRLCLFLGIGILLLPELSHPASIKNLTGSYNSLPQELRSLSLLDGAIGLETNIIRRSYHALPVAQMNKAAIELIKTLFYVIPSSRHFKLSTKLDYQTLVPTLINNLVYLEIKNQVGSQLIANSNEFLMPLEKHIHKKNQTTPSIQFLEAATPEVARLTLLTALWYYKSKVRDFNYEKLLQQTLIQICNKLLAKKTTPAEITNRIHNIKKAAESMEKSTSKIREYANTFFRGINNLIQPQEHHSLNTEEESKNENQLDYEKTVIKALTIISGRTKHPEHLEQTFDANITLNKQACKPFADCVETLLRNLFNILAYDPVQSKLSHTYLLQHFPNAHPKLIEFYKKYPLIDCDETNTLIKNQKEPASYNDWAKLVSAIPGVWYIQQSPAGKLNDFEIEPTFANLIIITNHLLGLNWFPPLQKYPESEQQTKTPENNDNVIENENNELSLFLKTNLPKFIALFGSTKSSLDSLGQYGTIVIDHPTNYSFFISLNNGHGHMEYLSEDLDFPLLKSHFEKYPLLWLLAPIIQWPTEELPPSIFHLFAHPIDQQNILRSLPRNLPKLPISWLPSLEYLINKTLSDTDGGKTKTILTLYAAVLNSNDINILPKPQKEALMQKSLSMAKKNLRTALTTSSETPPNIVHITKEAAVKLLDALISRGYGISEAISLAPKLCKNKLTSTQKIGLMLFTSLVKQGYAYPEATKAALSKLNYANLEWSIMLRTHDLIKELAKNDIELNMAVKAAINISKYNNAKSLELFELLISKNKGLKELNSCLQEMFLDKTHLSYHQTGKELVLLETLLNQGIGITETIATASAGILDESDSIRKNALKLFATLFTINKGFDEALEAATKNLSNTKPEIRETAILLFNHMVEHGHGYQAALVAAIQGTQEEFLWIQETALKLFQKLVQKNIGLQEAITAASEAILVKKIQSDKVINLFKELFNKNIGYKEAIKTAAQGILNKNSISRYYSIKLFKTLFDYGQGYQEAFQSALAITETDSHSALKLYLSLFAYNNKLSDENTEKILTTFLNLPMIFLLSKKSEQRLIKGIKNALLTTNQMAYQKTLSLLGKLLYAYKGNNGLKTLAAEAVQKCIDNPNIKTRKKALKVITSLGINNYSNTTIRSAVISLLQKYTHDSNKDIRATALKELAIFIRGYTNHHALGIKIAKQYLHDLNSKVQYQANYLLETLKSENPNHHLACVAYKALKIITAQNTPNRAIRTLE